jgi:hypothetical protein
MCQVILSDELEAIRRRMLRGDFTQAREDLDRLFLCIDAAAHTLALRSPNAGPSLSERCDWILDFWGVPTDPSAVRVR